MAGFFEDRWNGMKNGAGTIYDGGARLINQAFGWQEQPEGNPGAVGWLIETGRAAINGLFSKEKGLFRVDQGYNLAPWKKESTWNIMRHVRRATSAVFNTGSIFTTKFIGILSPSIGNFLSRMSQGIFTMVTAPVLGDVSPYLGPSKPTIYNDGSYKAANSSYYGEKAANDADYGATKEPKQIENTAAAETAPAPEAPKAEPVATPEPPKTATEPEKNVA